MYAAVREFRKLDILQSFYDILLKSCLLITIFFTFVSTQNKILITIIHLAVQTVTKHLFFLATMVMTRLTCLVLLFKIVGEICYCCLFCVIVKKHFNNIFFIPPSYCYIRSYFSVYYLILKISLRYQLILLAVQILFSTKYIGKPVLRGLFWMQCWIMSDENMLYTKMHICKNCICWKTNLINQASSLLRFKVLLKYKPVLWLSILYYCASSLHL